MQEGPGPDGPADPADGEESWVVRTAGPVGLRLRGAGFEYATQIRKFEHLAISHQRKVTLQNVSLQVMHSWRTVCLRDLSPRPSEVHIRELRGDPFELAVPPGLPIQDLRQQLSDRVDVPRAFGLDVL